jgi:hypothetical protein
MIIIGTDYHPSCQQIAFVDTETGDSDLLISTSNFRSLMKTE